MILVPPLLLVGWLGSLTLVGFATMGVDKLLAVGGRGRIRERTLWLTALLGGFLGIIAGGMVFHHKTSKTAFWPPVAVCTVLWLVALSTLIKAG
ncbi:MAG: DUF1294 domain-containing protein [Nitrososphaerota archaeon]|nr:DUF1294 domain-containing protein [Nitrososphaerota archaeon]MDG6978934.1 DUF1294 domain-containing protein [Nitrososphaerota archaeon]MDG6981126.1 DUF1294 domain-containing protein [Nitrososphaerota archaeon]